MGYNDENFPLPDPAFTWVSNTETEIALAQYAVSQACFNSHDPELTRRLWAVHAELRAITRALRQRAELDGPEAA